MRYEKVLVSYYSRTGFTKKVAEKLCEIYGFDTEEIIDKKERGGVINYILSGKDAMQEKETEIKDVEKDISKYDMVIIGMPVWASNMPPAVRTYVNKVKDKINNVAFICTQGGSGADKALGKLENLINKKSKGNLVLLSKEISKNSYEEKLKNYADQLFA